MWANPKDMNTLAKCLKQDVKRECFEFSLSPLYAKYVIEIFLKAGTAIEF